MKMAMFYIKKYHFLLVIMILACLYSCARQYPRDCEPIYFPEPTMTTICIVDRNGLMETISAKDRLQQYKNVDFLKPQPYQQVLRIYSRDVNGNLPSYITSYYPNGQLKRYLEAVNSRAHGKYQEWHQNGVLKVDATVVGGSADLSEAAIATWLFDGHNYAWNEDKSLYADIFYEKGELQGESIYYHSNGVVWKRVPYDKNQINGTMEVFLDNGALLFTTCFVDGVKEGVSVRYWEEEKIAAKEYYKNGLLETGHYYDKEGQLVAHVENGEGVRALFNKEDISELHEYRQGVAEGEIKVLDERGYLSEVYRIKNGIKHGEEIYYFEPSPFQDPSTYKLRPQLLITWNEGKMQGIVKTWYMDGQPESQREMSNNKKNGLLTAWYRDGSIMLIEEYENNKLIKGEYFRKGDRNTVSQVSKGKGVATLFDSDGNFLRKIPYFHGRVIN